MRIIAEAGCNWHSIEEAKEFIRKSKELNLFATKFQIYNDSIIKDSKDYEFLKSIMLDYDKAKELYEYGKEIEQNIFFTCMTLESLEWIDKIGCKYIKTRYADRFNLDLMFETSLLVFYGKLTWFLSIDEEPLEYYNKLKEKAYWDKFDSRFPTFNALYCVPYYPTIINSYLNDELFDIWSASDHTNDLRLFKIAQILDFKYFERHMCLTKDCLESQWSSTFTELEEVLKP